MRIIDNPNDSHDMTHPASSTVAGHCGDVVHLISVPCHYRRMMYLLVFFLLFVCVSKVWRTRTPLNTKTRIGNYQSHKISQSQSQMGSWFVNIFRDAAARAPLASTAFKLLLHMNWSPSSFFSKIRPQMVFMAKWTAQSVLVDCPHVCINA